MSEGPPAATEGGAERVPGSLWSAACSCPGAEYCARAGWKSADVAVSYKASAGAENRTSSATVPTFESKPAAVASTPPVAAPLSGVLPAGAVPLADTSRADSSSCMSSSHDPYRSAGSFAIARASTALTARGRSGRITATGGGVSIRCAQSSAASSSRRKGGRPVRHS
jgi:hypothetical protein